MSKQNITLAILCGVTIALAACNEALLQQATDRYVTTQSTGSISWLSPLLSPNATYLENGKTYPSAWASPSTIPTTNLTTTTTTTTLTTPVRIDHRHSIYDLTQCASFTSIVSTDPSSPRVIGAQLWLSPSTNQITKLDRIHTTPGDWLFNATGTLHYSLQEDWLPIPPTSSLASSRETIKAAADAYLDIFKNASVQVPWGTPCARLEGGAYTGRGLANDTCNLGVIQSYDMPNRRYVIDERVGVVSLLLEFGSIGNAPDSHLFKVEGGKLRFIRTMTYCEKKPNCGYTLGGGGGGWTSSG